MTSSLGVSASLAGSAWWWPAVVILVAGCLATQVWRWLGVLLSGRVSPTGALFAWARLVATAIIGALAAQLIVQPQGALQIVPLWLRLASVGAGLAVMVALWGRPSNLSVGLLAALGVMTVGYLAFGPV